MATRHAYHTRQKELVLSCLRENQGRHLTVELILAELRQRGERVGQTTVYRNLEKLVDSGVIIKFSAPSGMSSCYQYREETQNSEGNFHLVCVDCGRMLHVDCKYIDHLSTHMQQEHRFYLDPMKTVLYGRCESCASH